MNALIDQLAALRLHGMAACAQDVLAARTPPKTSGDYACEVAELTTEIMDEVLAGMPMEIQLPEWAVPECEKETT